MLPLLLYCEWPFSSAIATVWWTCCLVAGRCHINYLPICKCSARQIHNRETSAVKMCRHHRPGRLSVQHKLQVKVKLYEMWPV